MNLLTKPILPQGYSVAQTAKSWVAFLGPALAVVVYALQQALQFMPADWVVPVTGVISIASGILAFYVPNADRTPTVAATPGPISPWPTT